MLDERTIYNYVDAGLLSVGNMDLPRKVRYKVRKRKPSVRVDKQCHLGRTYEDFLEYTAANPDVPIVEIDSVEGRKGAAYSVLPQLHPHAGLSAGQEHGTVCYGGF